MRMLTQVGVHVKGNTRINLEHKDKAICGVQYGVLSFDGDVHLYLDEPEIARIRDLLNDWLDKHGTEQNKVDLDAEYVVL